MATATFGHFGPNPLEPLAKLPKTTWPRLSSVWPLVLRRIPGTFSCMVPKKRQHLEHTEQSRFFAVLRRLKHPAAEWTFAIPNGFLFDKSLRIKAWREGATSGVWDVFVPWPLPLKGFHGLWIEFKSPKGTLSASQVQFANSMAPRGYKLVVVRSYREALKAFCEYVGIEVR